MQIKFEIFQSYLKYVNHIHNILIIFKIFWSYFKYIDII